MRIVFWQNSLSPHQLPYIVHLLEDERVDSVVVCAGEAINRARKNMGWDTTSYPGLENCDVYLNPTSQTVEHLMQVRTEDSYHLFSGIRGFAFVFDAFLRSLAYPIKRGMITERPNTYAYGQANGKPLWLHRLRWKLQDRKFTPKVNCVFAMGSDAADFFKSVSAKWNVFPFAYCVQNLSVQEQDKRSDSHDATIKVVFVGSLSVRKSVDTLIEAARLCRQQSLKHAIEFYIIGDGNEKMKLQGLATRYGLDNVLFLGSKKQSMVSGLLCQYDVLVLPSIYDGWGAVVNEGLQAGLYTICSDTCGAKDLLTDIRCGTVFQHMNSKELAEIILKLSAEPHRIKEFRGWRKEWAEKCISGNTISKYMVDCLFGNKEITEPWKKQ